MAYMPVLTEIAHVRKTQVSRKYIDDCSQVASVNLRVSLTPDLVDRPRPLNFHERTGMVLGPEENVLQQEMERFQKKHQQIN